MAYSKLKGRIVEKYDTMRNFAKELGISRQALSMKMTGKRQFSMDEIRHYSDLLEIPKDEIGTFFFE